MTVRVSSIHSSNGCPVGPRSDSPVPGRSKRISRLNDASLRRKLANAGCSHCSARWVGHPRKNSRSIGPSPSTWYAIAVPAAFRVKHTGGP